jgi:hypothetical protein
VSVGEPEQEPKVRRWDAPDDRPPQRPYRDTLVLHAVLAAVIVGGAVLTGGSLERGLVYAAIFFVLATAWSWWRWRERLEAERRRIR